MRNYSLVRRGVSAVSASPPASRLTLERKENHSEPAAAERVKHNEVDTTGTQAEFNNAKLTQKAQAIFDTFFSSDSELELNVDYYVKQVSLCVCV